MGNTSDYGVGDYQVVAGRITFIEGRAYVRCPIHGLLPLDHHCSHSPGDHWCRAAAHPCYDPASGVDGLDDQATSHEAWAATQAAKIHYIARLHRRTIAATGRCVECAAIWPCRSAHMANAWGEREECEALHWCRHARVALPEVS